MSLIIDNEIKSSAHRMKQRFHQFHSLTLQEKRQANSKNLKTLQQKRDQTCSLIDNCFNELIKKLTQRREILKLNYNNIVMKQYKRLKMQNQVLDSQFERSTQLQSDINDFLNDFDNGIDFSANKGALSQLVNDFKIIYQNSVVKKGMFFSGSKFKNPSFSLIRDDVKKIERLGTIIDRRMFTHPMVTFNTTSLQAYEYIDQDRCWLKRELLDDTESLFAKLPKYFKSQYIGNDSFLLIGGFDPIQNSSADSCFLLDNNGTIKNFPALCVPRQYLATAFDEQQREVFCVGGFNHYTGVLGSAQIISVGAKKWEFIQDLNHPRLNAAACRVGQKYTYVFGGRNQNSFLDSIQRYNKDYNIWNLLNIALPHAVSNLNALPLPNNSHDILIIGGLKHTKGKAPFFGVKNQQQQFQIQDRVYIFKQQKGYWIRLKDFPYRKKIGQSTINSKGQIFCQMFNNSSELPELYTYDLRRYYPQFDQYVLQEIFRKKRQREQDIQPSDLQGGRDILMDKDGRQTNHSLNKTHHIRTASSTDDYFMNRSAVLSRAGRAKGLKPGRKSIKQIEMIEFPSGDKGNIRTKFQDEEDMLRSTVNIATPTAGGTLFTSETPLNFKYRNSESVGPASGIFMSTQEQGSEVLTFSPQARKKYMLGERVSDAFNNPDSQLSSNYNRNNDNRSAAISEFSEGSGFFK